MTRAAEASQEADTAIRLPLIEGILADLAAINLSTVQLPQDHICSHFVPVGNATDQIKRLLVLRAATRKELETLTHQALASIFSRIGDDFSRKGGGLGKLTEILSGKLEIENSSAGERASRRLSIINMMLTDAYEIGFPEHVDRELLVKQDGDVGYLDHSGLMEEAKKEFLDAIKSGTFDFSSYPPEVVEALKAGDYDVESVGDHGFAIRVRRPAPAES